MDLREKRTKERNKHNEERKEEIISAAISAFLEKGIDKTSINDIAKLAEVGPATVYRHFENKQQIVIGAAIKLFQGEIVKLEPRVLSGNVKKESGIAQVNYILSVFIILYNEYPEFIKFLDEFDNYVVREGIDTRGLEEYEKNILNLRKILFSALEKGKNDGTIRQDVNNNSFYMSITHALISLSQKLLLRGNILKSDNDINGITQLHILIEMAVKFIQK